MSAARKQSERSRLYWALIRDLDKLKGVRDSLFRVRDDELIDTATALERAAKIIREYVDGETP